jgi:hypothetical protein
MAKLFRVTVVLFVAIVSVALLGVVFSAVVSSLPFPMISHSDGVGAVAGGVSEKLIRAVFLLAVLMSAGILYWRGRRSR